MVQRFDPPGVGARDLQECLLLQLNQRMAKDKREGKEPAQCRELAFQILSFYFDEFSKKHYHKLAKYLEITEEELRDATTELDGLKARVGELEEEKAQLLYTAGLSAIKNGDKGAAAGLLEEAIDTHPRHFDAAVRSLEALETRSVNG